mmetsp:Transcript_23809/g.56599  ORF Transcript_23809/g.56599 Transcript_23809/m.56599 type:complete len:215 (-) Transcript_23809:640-1284(-)
MVSSPRNRRCLREPSARRKAKTLTPLSPASGSDGRAFALSSFSLSASSRCRCAFCSNSISEARIACSRASCSALSRSFSRSASRDWRYSSCCISRKSPSAPENLLPTPSPLVERVLLRVPPSSATSIGRRAVSPPARDICIAACNSASSDSRPGVGTASLLDPARLLFLKARGRALPQSLSWTKAVNRSRSLSGLINPVMWSSRPPVVGSMMSI